MEKRTIRKNKKKEKKKKEIIHRNVHGGRELKRDQSVHLES